jgi:hypothetical protein
MVPDLSADLVYACVVATAYQSLDIPISNLAAAGNDH